MTAQQKRTLNGLMALQLCACFFALIGVVSLTSTTNRLMKNQQLVRSGIRTQGLVSAIKKTSGGRSIRVWPEIRFELPGGVAVTFQSLHHPRYCSYREGQVVPVLYNSNDPRIAEINEPDQLWGGMGGDYTVGGIFVLAGAGVLLYGRWRQRHIVPHPYHAEE